jgi:hypothetical protein
MILATHGIVASYVGVSYDADAQAFITAANITNNTQKSAINQLVLDLKTYGIWTKMKALYPFVGGTAFSHKFNLKDPRDLDIAFRLSFIGGGTHSLTGYLPNGSDAYANTNFISSSVLSVNSTHISYYSRTNTNTGVDISSRYITGDPGITYIYIRDTGTSYSRINAIGSDTINSNSDGRGMYISSRFISGSFNFFKNTTKTTINTSSSGLPIREIDIASISSNGSRSFGNKECAFVSIGDGLIDTEATNLYTAVNAFQVALSRNV